MKQSLVKYSFLVCLTFVSACASYVPESRDAGSPEALLDVSSEAETLSLKGKKSLNKLKEVVSNDRPDGVELQCSAKSKNCKKAKKMFEKQYIPVEVKNSKENKAVLHYERAIARDCDQRYVDNMSGSRSLNHSAFGCSVASNMVQMISNKKQLTNPNLSDLPDAEKYSQSYRDYLKPSSQREVAKEADWKTGSSSK